MAEFLTRDEYGIRHVRLVWAIVLQFVFITLAFGLAFQLNQGIVHQRCVDNRNRTLAAAKALPNIVGAARADGDTHQADFWNGYLVQQRARPPVKC